MASSSSSVQSAFTDTHTHLQIHLQVAAVLGLSKGTLFSLTSGTVCTALFSSCKLIAYALPCPAQQLRRQQRVHWFVWQIYVEQRMQSRQAHGQWKWSANKSQNWSVCSFWVNAYTRWSCPVFVWTHRLSTNRLYVLHQSSSSSFGDRDRD